MGNSCCAGIFNDLNMLIILLRTYKSWDLDHTTIRHVVLLPILMSADMWMPPNHKYSFWYMLSHRAKPTAAWVYVTYCESVQSGWCRLHTFTVNYVYPSGWFCSVAPHIYFVLKSELKLCWFPLSWVMLQIVYSGKIVYLVFKNVNVFF